VASFIGECNFLEGEIRAVEATGALFSTRSGATFGLSPRPGLRAGMAGIVAIRPEDMTILTDADVVPAGDNAVAGTVRSLTYLGPVSQYEVALEGGQRLLVYEQGQRRGSRRLSEGDRVRVAWPQVAGSLQLQEEKRS
jgi:ABC-type Fe3+/spermidine/putrescine transport system ATPase subunit